MENPEDVDDLFVHGAAADDDVDDHVDGFVTIAGRPVAPSSH